MRQLWSQSVFRVFRHIFNRLRFCIDTFRGQAHLVTLSSPGHLQFTPSAKTCRISIVGQLAFRMLKHTNRSASRLQTLWITIQLACKQYCAHLDDVNRMHSEWSFPEAHHLLKSLVWAPPSTISSGNSHFAIFR